MKRCLFFLIVFCQSLVAEEEQDFSLVNLTKSPISRAAGAVNIITGNWVDQATHAQTSGPDPYVVGHSYISSSLEEGSLADGWDLYHPSELEVYQPRGIQYVSKCPPTIPFGDPQLADVPPMQLIELGCHHHKRELKPPKKQKPDKPPRDHKAHPYPLLRDEPNDAKLLYREAGGAMYLFKGDNNAKHFRPKIHKTGYNHISSIDTPSRRDFRRAEVYWNNNHDEWVVTLGDGTRRTYARTEKHRRRPEVENFIKATYHIKEELLPSGNRRWYHYDDDKELKLIQTVSSDEKHVVHFVEFHRKHDFVDVTTSEGLSTRFSLKKLRDDETAHVVDGIERASKGKFSFSYCDKSSRHTRRIEGSAVRTPDAITQSSTTKERTPLLASGTG